jgi:hypothetical protein
VTITGDKHHYIRYTRSGSEGPRERITAGGGGAHTSATHGLDHPLRLRPHDSETTIEYEPCGIYPDPDESRRMRWAIFSRIFRFGWLGLVTALIYAVLALLFADGVKDQSVDLQANLEGRSWSEVFLDGIAAWNVVTAALLLIGLWIFAGARTGPWLPGWRRALLSILHTAFHVVPALLLAALALFLLDKETVKIGGLELFDGSGAAESGLAMGWIVALVVGTFGFFLGRLVFAAYLLLANEVDARHHATELYGGLASTEFKNFLRMKLDRDEVLTIYPIGIRRAPTWTLLKSSDRTDPWFTVEKGELDPQLIEDPIRVPADG